jgi:hypothetical protein
LLGTVISGTLKTNELLEAFADTLEWLLTNKRKRISTEEFDRLARLCAEARDWAETPDGESASDVLDEMFDALNGFASKGCYFGAHPGDGADFGFWPEEEDYPHVPHFDCMKDGEPS